MNSDEEAQSLIDEAANDGILWSHIERNQQQCWSCECLGKDRAGPFGPYCFKLSTLVDLHSGCDGWETRV